MLPFEPVSKQNWRKWFSLAEIRYFLIVGLPLITIMASKIMNERISFPLNKISVATGHNKELVKNIFPKGRKTASKGRDI